MERFYSMSTSEAPINGYPRIPEFGYQGSISGSYSRPMLPYV